MAERQFREADYQDADGNFKACLTTPLELIRTISVIQYTKCTRSRGPSACQMLSTRKLEIYIWLTSSMIRNFDANGKTHLP